MSAFSSSSQGKRWLYGSLDALHQAQMSLHSELSSSSSRATPSESNEELAARLKEESYIIRQFCNYILNGVGPTNEGDLTLLPLLVAFFQLTSLHFTSLQFNSIHFILILQFSFLFLQRVERSHPSNVAGRCLQQPVPTYAASISTRVF